MPLSRPAEQPSSRETRELALAFRALGNPHRLAIYIRLLQHAESKNPALLNSCALQELIDKLDIGAPTISHHVKELVTAGLISVTRDGKYLRCKLNEDRRRELSKLLGSCKHDLNDVHY